MSEQTIDKHTIMVICAAVSAYLGKNVRIRRARFIKSQNTAWATEGRTTVQEARNAATTL